MSRLVDWWPRLRTAVEETRALPGKWGSHDCGAFTLGRCVEAVTGFNPISDVIGTYSDWDGALAIMQSRGADDVEEFAALFLERWTDPKTGADAPQRGRRGDIGVVRMPEGKTLVVIMGAICVTPGVRCMHLLPRTKMTAAFKVD